MWPSCSLVHIDLPVRSQRDKYLWGRRSWEFFLTPSLSHAWFSSIVSQLCGNQELTSLPGVLFLSVTVDCYIHHPSEVTTSTCVFWFFLLGSNVILSNWVKPLWIQLSSCWCVSSDSQLTQLPLLLPSRSHCAISLQSSRSIVKASLLCAVICQGFS